MNVRPIDNLQRAQLAGLGFPDDICWHDAKARYLLAWIEVEEMSVGQASELAGVPPARIRRWRSDDAMFKAAELSVRKHVPFRPPEPESNADEFEKAKVGPIHTRRCAGTFRSPSPRTAAVTASRTAAITGGHRGGGSGKSRDPRVLDTSGLSGARDRMSALSDALGIPSRNDDPWWKRAACIGYPYSHFFPDGGSRRRSGSTLSVDRPKRICARCPVRRECLTETLHAEAHTSVIVRNVAANKTVERRTERILPVGTFGGTIPQERWADDVVHRPDCERPCVGCVPITERVETLEGRFRFQSSRFLTKGESVL